jgi:UDP-N-acetyl-D-glucosamine dehydrogenase
MKMMFDKMGIDIWEVIDAAAKKPFGFTPFYPGPGIGGDCIPVDPYYLVWKAKETSAPTRLIELAAEVNEQMTDFVLHKIIHALGLEGKTAQQGKVLILGAAFKKDVNDIRESSSIKIIYQLMKEHIPLSYHDPFVPQLTPSSRYPELMLKSVMWDKIHLADFDCVVILTDHSSYDWRYIGTMARRIVDTRNVMASYKEYNHKVVKA